MSTINRAIQNDQQLLDQRWAAMREFYWSLGAEQAKYLDDLFSKQSADDVLAALQSSRRTLEVVLQLARLTHDQVLNNCWDEQIAIEADPQAASADAIQEVSDAG